MNIRTALPLCAALAAFAMTGCASQPPPVAAAPRPVQADLPPEQPKAAAPEKDAKAAPSAPAAPDADSKEAPSDGKLVGLDAPDGWTQIDPRALAESPWEIGFANDALPANILVRHADQDEADSFNIVKARSEACEAPRVCTEPSLLPEGDGFWFSFTSPTRNGAVAIRDLGDKPGNHQITVLGIWNPESQEVANDAFLDVVTNAKMVDAPVGAPAPTP